MDRLLLIPQCNKINYDTRLFGPYRADKTTRTLTILSLFVNKLPILFRILHFHISFIEFIFLLKIQ